MFKTIAKKIIDKSISLNDLDLANIDCDSLNHLFQISIEYDNFEIFKGILESRRINIDIPGRYYFRLCAKLGKVDYLKELIKYSNILNTDLKAKLIQRLLDNNIQAFESDILRSSYDSEHCLISD